MEVQKEHSAVIEAQSIVTKSTSLLMRLDQATVDMLEGASPYVVVRPSPITKGLTQLLGNGHLHETQKVALMESLSRHILKIERLFLFMVFSLRSYSSPTSLLSPLTTSA